VDERRAHAEALRRGERGEKIFTTIKKYKDKTYKGGRYNTQCYCDYLCTSAEQVDALRKTFPALPAKETQCFYFQFINLKNK